MHWGRIYRLPYVRTLDMNYHYYDKNRSHLWWSALHEFASFTIAFMIPSMHPEWNSILKYTSCVQANERIIYRLSAPHVHVCFSWMIANTFTVLIRKHIYFVVVFFVWGYAEVKYGVLIGHASQGISITVSNYCFSLACSKEIVDFHPRQVQVK